MYECMYVCVGPMHVCMCICISISLGEAFDVESSHVLQQGGLSDAVAADETVSPAIHYAQVGPFQQYMPAVGDVEVGHYDVLLPVVSREIRQGHGGDLVALLLSPDELDLQIVQPLLLLLHGFAFVLG